MFNYTWNSTKTDPTMATGNQIDNWMSNNPAFAEQVAIFKKYDAKHERTQAQMENEIPAVTPDTDMTKHIQTSRAIRNRWYAKMDALRAEYAAEVAKFGENTISYDQMVAMSWPGEDQ